MRKKHLCRLLAHVVAARKGSTLEQFVKAGSMWEGPMLEMFRKDCLAWVEPHPGTGGECEEKGETEAKYYELTATPVPHPLLGGRR